MRPLKIREGDLQNSINYAKDPTQHKLLVAFEQRRVYIYYMDKKKILGILLYARIPILLHSVTIVMGILKINQISHCDNTRSKRY